MDNELIEIARTAIGQEFGLSEAQARRLRGESARELRRDAATMRAELGLEPINPEPQRDERGRYTGFEAGDMNAIIRAAAGR